MLVAEALHICRDIPFSFLQKVAPAKNLAGQVQMFHWALCDEIFAFLVPYLGA